MAKLYSTFILKIFQRHFPTRRLSCLFESRHEDGHLWHWTVRREGMLNIEGQVHVGALFPCNFNKVGRRFSKSQNKIAPFCWTFVHIIKTQVAASNHGRSAQNVQWKVKLQLFELSVSRMTLWSTLYQVRSEGFLKTNWNKPCINLLIHKNELHMFHTINLPQKHFGSQSIALH